MSGLSLCQKVLVTGAAGFIGSHLVDQMLLLGHDVTGVDDLSSSNLNNLTAALKHKNFKPSFVSVAEHISSRKRGDEPYSLILHMAAQNGIAKSIQAPMTTFYKNVTTTMDVLEYCRKHGSKLVYASSSSVYGARMYVDESLGNLEPLNPYSMGKLTCEHYARIYHELYDVTSIGLRFFNVYGPRQRFDRNLGPVPVIPQFLLNLHKKEPVLLFGEDSTRYFTYIADVIKTIGLIADKIKGADLSDVFNVNYHHDHLVRDALEQACIAFRKMTSKIGVEIRELPKREGEINGYIAKSYKLRNFIGYDPDTPLEMGIKDTAKYYKQAFKMAAVL